MKTKEEILANNGIDIMSLNDSFNCSLLMAMEEYASQQVAEKDREIAKMKEVIAFADEELSRLKTGNPSQLLDRVVAAENELSEFKALVREIRSLSKEKPDLMVDEFINDKKIEHLETKVDNYLQE